MREIIDYFNNYITNEGYEIIETGKDKGYITLASSVKGREEYHREYNSKEEQHALLMSETIVATENMINMMIEDAVMDIPFKEEPTADIFLKRIDNTKTRLNHIIKQLDQLSNMLAI